MVITLTGDNQYLIDAEISKLKIGLDADGLSVTKINAQEVSLEDLKMELSSYSLFSEQRLIILYVPSKVKGFDEYIEEASSNLADQTTVVIVEPTLDKRKTYYKYLQAKTDFRQFAQLSGAALTKWAEDYVKELGGSISPGDTAYLIDRVGDDQLLLSQEITKLILYSEDINRTTIDLLTEQSASSTIFELLDAAFSLNSKKALNIYTEQRLQKVEPEQILAMISWQLNTLALYMTSKNLSSSQITSGSGLSPYTLSKARQIAAKLVFSDLKRLVGDLSSLDLRSKTTSFDLDEGLKNFIVGLNY
ncbi:MAG TPA: DNA polymerase III subunit delta [Candidatus Saccharimonadales bacterium]